ncbi:hypothetical protein AXF42_Ash001723 [Apostasia shenzhenica]|uniref:Uncharacterized protein n=1 Tax=Apostasia shenzhenica TaxID=1088818 RepID=A0A2I0AB22_9ASPA|nr:hypothetical protein AXF42_Ash001723 [Apostasia shenzhenica]
MVARTRGTNSAVHSTQTGEPSVKAPGDETSASTSRRHPGSTSSFRGTRISELQGMLANLTDLVTGLTTQQAVFFRQTQLVCSAVLSPTPLSSVTAVCDPLPRVATVRDALPRVAPVPEPLPLTAAVPVPLPAGDPSVQSSSSSQPLRYRLPHPEVHQNQNPLPPFAPCPLPQHTFFPPAFPPFLAGRNSLFPSIQALSGGPDAFFGSLDGNASFSDTIRQTPVPEDFRPPRLEAYRGTTDPREHIQGFEAAIRYFYLDEATKCHLLANTLKGATFS